MKAKMQAQLDSGADPTAVDTVSGATWSSKSIIEAYNASLASVPKAAFEEGIEHGEEG